MLKGRLGLETARVPYKDRHGLMWLGRGNLSVTNGNLEFTTAGTGELAAGDYGIPFQTLTCIVLQPGSTVSHDALRLMARHGTALLAAGDGGVRLYASMPFGPDASGLARRQATLWANEEKRLGVARRIYAWRLGELLPERSLSVLRGIEGARVKALYKRLADQHGIPWTGRSYDRQNPEATNHLNQVINHAAVATRSCAMVAVAAVGAIPQLGFIHEDSGIAFSLDIADLFRDSITLPIAFSALAGLKGGRDSKEDLERLVRKRCGEVFRRKKVVSNMIDKIKALLDKSDSGVDPEVMP